MEALPAVHNACRVVFMKGARVSASEGGNCWLGYIMDRASTPVQPAMEPSQATPPTAEESSVTKSLERPAHRADPRSVSVKRGPDDTVPQA